MTTHMLQRPDGRLAYDCTGTGPLVIAIPGMGDLRQNYRHLLPHLLHGHRVATMDLRGHGDSEATFTEHGDVPTGRDALALADALSPTEPVVLVGSSMGAAAALWAAAERPDRVRALVLLGPFARDGAVPAPLTWLMRVALTRPWGPALWPAYQQTLYAGRPPADHAEHRARLRQSLRHQPHWKAFRATVLGTSHAVVEERLDQVQAPALVVMGAKDPDFPDPAAEAAWLGDRLGCEVVVRPDSGHYPHADDAPAVGAAVAAFLSRVDDVRAHTDA